MDFRDIQDILPHRWPMLLVDRILEVEAGKRIVGVKNIAGDEIFFQGHFPGNPVLPGVMMIEAMAQVGGVLVLGALENRKDLLVYFMGIDKARFRKPVVPGDQLRLEVSVLKMKSRVCKMRGEAFVEGVLVAEAEFTSALVSKNDSDKKKV